MAKRKQVSDFEGIKARHQQPFVLSIICLASLTQVQKSPYGDFFEYRIHGLDSDRPDVTIPEDRKKTGLITPVIGHGIRAGWLRGTEEGNTWACPMIQEVWWPATPCTGATGHSQRRLLTSPSKPGQVGHTGVEPSCSHTPALSRCRVAISCFLCWI
jgi:hypothetical protein